MLLPTPLTAPEVDTLEACALRGPHPRMRRRAQAVLCHHRGLSVNQVAAGLGVHRNAVSGWLLRWQRHGVAGLAEGRRAGRPPKLAAAAKKK